MATQIRAAVCRTFGESLSIENLHLAPPRTGQVEVRILASAVCHSDIHFFDGAWGGRLPAVWGHEAAGVVEALGEGVDDVAIGDLVVVTLIRSCGSCRQCRSGASAVCTGITAGHPSPLSDLDGNPVAQGLGTAAFAERAVVDRSQIVVVDPKIDPNSACLLACGVITGVGAARNTASVEPGSSVVVIGTGGVGLNTVQGARLAGADPIVAVDLTDDRLATARSFGATQVVNSSVQDLYQAVKTITDGEMADYVFVTVGAQAPIEMAPALLAPNGAAVIVGMPASGVTASIDPVTLAAQNQRILGSKMGGATLATDVPELVKKYRSGELMLDELVTATYPIEGINEAIESVKNGQAVRNVIVFAHDGPVPADGSGMQVGGR